MFPPTSPPNRIFTGFLALTIFCILHSCKNPKPEAHIAPAKGYEIIAQKLTEAIEYEIADKQLNAISMVLVDGQEIVWSQGFGFEDKLNNKAADAQTIYRVGSVSKLFTDIAMMQGVEKGEIDLDAPVKTYLPNFQPNNPYDQAITLRQLMSHRSGLLREPRLGNYYDDQNTSLKETVESIQSSRLIYEPETKIKYSNAGIAVVGYVLEQLYKQPYADYMQQHILTPIGMNRSAFVANSSIQERLAKASIWGYDRPDFPAPTFELGMSPAGSLYASITDLGIFLQMLFNEGEGKSGRLLKKETLETMWQPQFGGETTSGYGIGFGLSDFEGYQKVGHGGAIYGFSTQLYAVPALKLGVACASSVDLTNAITRRLSNYALSLMHAYKTAEELPEYETSEPIENQIARSLAGLYQAGETVIEIVQKNDQLFLSADDFEVRLKKGKEGIIPDGRIQYGGLTLKQEGEAISIDGTTFAPISAVESSDFPADWEVLIGEYGPDYSVVYVYEDMGSMWALFEWFEKDQLTHIAGDTFAFPKAGGMFHGERLIFNRDEHAEVRELVIENGPIFSRRDVGASTSETFRIKVVKPVEELRDIALAATPPDESGSFEQADLVSLKSLDESIKYDIRYASTNNFMSAEFYTLSEAYMQRPAAEALLRAHRQLKLKGYGLLIHDAYRPWYVSKMFWDATPADKKIFVANPDEGSRHNRGCAVDLTLYDIKTGEVIEMVAGYDEMTDRSFPDYFGGTTAQRWHRALLRRAMEAQGFSVYEYEWWHFDYQDWQKYPIMNVKFEDL